MKEERQKCHTAVLNSITTVDGKPLSSIDDYLEELAVIDKDRKETRQDLDGVVYVNDYYQKAIALPMARIAVNFAKDRLRMRRSKCRRQPS